MKTATVVISLFLVSSLALGGDLNPPAPPTAPTMKTLDQVEPRIPIPASSTPAEPFFIGQSGSYYLTGDRHCGGNGIQVDANDVTIDLSGYALIGTVSASTYGISMSGRRNVEIRNGTVRDFLLGIGSDDICRDLRITGIRAVNNTLTGIYLLGRNHLVKECTANNNGITGIFVQYAGTITGNIASGNGFASVNDVYGIYAGGNSTITGNTACYNGDYAFGGYVNGIYAGSGSTVTHNTVCCNGSSANGSVYGIYVDPGCTAADNTVSHNGYYAAGNAVFGLYAMTGCRIAGNTACDNGDSAASYAEGIHAGTGCTVTGNTACSNGDAAGASVYGIYLAGYNLVDQNTAYLNGAGAAGATNIDTHVTGCVYGLNVAP